MSIYLKTISGMLTLVIYSLAHSQVVELAATGQQPSVVNEAGRRQPLYASSHALLISQRSYLGTAKGGWRPLDSTTREMDGVAESLRRHGFNVRRATDLTGSELITVFRDFMGDYGHRPDNRLLFFFSGHGYTNTQNDMGYIVPIDALDPNINPARFYSRALPIETIQTWARELSARHVLFIFDSCFSGSIFLSRAQATMPEQRGSQSSDRLAYFLGSSFKPVRQFIAAGGPKEELPATSVFVPLFLEALEGRAARTPDGYLTGKELGMWLEQTLPRYRQSQNPHSGVIRQPELSFGDMVFQVPNKLEPALPSSPPRIVATAPPTTQSPTLPAPQSSPPRPVTEKVTFSADAFFDSGKSLVPTSVYPKLDDLSTRAKSVNLEVIIAVGHADSVELSDPSARQRISVARAEAIKSYLVANGIEKNRVYTEGKGSSQPVADNRTLEGRAKNRRVELEAVGTRTRTP